MSEYKYHESDVDCPECGSKLQKAKGSLDRVYYTCYTAGCTTGIGSLPLDIIERRAANIQIRIDRAVEELERKYNLLEHAYKQLEDDYNNDVLATQENW